MGKKKKLVLKCHECGKEFKHIDPQVRICKVCVKKESAKELPRGPKPIEDMLK